MTFKKALVVLLVLVMVVVAAACGNAYANDDVKAEEELYFPPAGTVPYVDNDTAVRGEYAPFEPKEDADTFSGIAIEGNEEEELQQERIAGGAVGEATSILDPLHGITDYSEGEYVPMYGID